MSEITEKPKSVLLSMADRFGMKPESFEATVRDTIMPPGKAGAITQPQLTAFLMIAKEYNLNPVTKEIYAFPSRGGIMPIVGVDGWLRIINEHSQFDGMDLVENMEGSECVSITCSIYRKDRSRPVVVTEHMAECKGSTEPWKKWPMRMLRHKTVIQCARYAFGFSGIYEKDEAERVEKAIVGGSHTDASDVLSKLSESLKSE